MALRILIKIQSLCLLLGFVSVAFGDTDPGDYKILDEFRKGMTNAELLKWPDDNEDPCGPPRWPYVFCSGSRVTQIQAKNLGLVGTLPPDFNKLSMLANIGLQGNNFTGTLPSFKGLASLQYAYLDNNQFDTIPLDFFVGLDSLQVLALDRIPLNRSTGWMVPADLANSAQLTNLSLSNCNLAGPLPDFIGNMRSLIVLKLSYNRLTGEIPASYSGLPLQILWLNSQQAPGLSGSLGVVASMTFLTDAWLHGNQFSGTIPSSISALTSLNRLWLNNNQLVGLVPANLTSLPQLQSLHLDNNAFMGPIPKVSFSDFTYANNPFCHPTPGVACPPDVAALLGFLDGVGYPMRLARSWSGNDSCTGSWLGVSCASGKIAIINLPNFHLNGTLSPSLGELDSLVKIALGGNNLNGTIPSSLTRLKSLRSLDLSSNNLSPPVPQFPAGVTVVLDGNKMLGTSTPPGGDAPPKSPASSGASSSSSSSKTLLVIVPIAVVVIIVLLAVLFLLWRKKRKTKAPTGIVIQPRDSSADRDNFVKIAIASNGNISASASELRSMNSSSTGETHVIEAGNMVISIQVLRAATGNFAPENVLGRGGFGVVYKGELHDGTTIAVKRTESARVGNEALGEFQAEIAVLSKVRHRHLVSILGYSVEDNERLLVYEYMPQGALSKHLFHWKQLGLEPLSWKKRLNIALDVARGIEYLHNFAKECFIHRDLKSANILLGDDYRAKVSDFGLAKLAPDGKNSVATRLAGTFGYLAPEYAVTGKVTTKVDVFSFGVVLMELLTGLKALDEDRPDESRYLAFWFGRMKNTREKLESIVDPSLAVTEETLESICVMAELAGHCTARDPHQRPDMGHAVNVLAPLVEKWSPVDGDEPDDYLGIDLDQPLLQMVQGWQAADGAASGVVSLSVDCSKISIPARPSGFAESFTSADGR
ncbi:receptor protein kinase TMK1-like [Musa acuminata AAA Group]|uniref:receptor protein kinase TMK1-like n=1 Tax=Musa acuminata AAA Group TaxID=214697 RepID=UPI0031DE2B56